MVISSIFFISVYRLLACSKFVFKLLLKNEVEYRLLWIAKEKNIVTFVSQSQVAQS